MLLFVLFSDSLVLDLNRSTVIFKRIYMYVCRDLISRDKKI